jgi:hypothetical protein
MKRILRLHKFPTVQKSEQSLLLAEKTRGNKKSNISSCSLDYRALVDSLNTPPKSIQQILFVIGTQKTKWPE